MGWLKTGSIRSHFRGAIAAAGLSLAGSYAAVVVADGARATIFFVTLPGVSEHLNAVPDSHVV
jgi:hypothetical protein